MVVTSGCPAGGVPMTEMTLAVEVLLQSDGQRDAQAEHHVRVFACQFQLNVWQKTFAEPGQEYSS